METSAKFGVGFHLSMSLFFLASARRENYGERNRDGNGRQTRDLDEFGRTAVDWLKIMDVAGHGT